MSETARRCKRRRLFRSCYAHADIADLLAEIEPKGLCLDLPAGAGVNIEGIQRAGFEPIAADLYPERAAEKGVQVARADFHEPLPFEDGKFAAVLCSEGIEHCAMQFQLIREFARVLNPGGTLMVTTPNILNFRARLAFMLTGHKSFAGTPICEATQVWGKSDDGRLYIGHVFLASYFTLRYMMKMAGFDRIRVATAKYSPSAVLMAPFLWLPVRLATARLMGKARKRGPPEVADEVARHAMSADLLFGKKLIMLGTKAPADEAAVKA